MFITMHIDSYVLLCIKKYEYSSLTYIYQNSRLFTRLNIRKSPKKRPNPRLFTRTKKTNTRLFMRQQILRPNLRLFWDQITDFYQKTERKSMDTETSDSGMQVTSEHISSLARQTPRTTKVNQTGLSWGKTSMEKIWKDAWAGKEI